MHEFIRKIIQEHREFKRSDLNEQIQSSDICSGLVLSGMQKHQYPDFKMKVVDCDVYVIGELLECRLR